METFDTSRFYFQDPEKGIVKTPEPLAQEMIQKIPEYIFESSTTTFLDPACGRGTFLKVIAKKLKGYGHSWENITSRIFGIDIDPFSGIKRAQYFFGPKNIIVQDFLKMSFPDNWPKRFDVIVSNPPYGGTDVQNLHIKFLDKSIEVVEGKKGQIIFVHPSTQFVNKRTGDSVNKKIEKFISSLTFFNGGAVFGIEKHIPISFTHIDFSKKSKGFKVINEISGREAHLDKIDDINLFNEYHYIPNIEKKIKNVMSVENIESCESSVVFKGKRSNGPLISPESPYVRIQVFQGSVDNSSRNKLWKNNFFVLTTKNQIAELPGDSNPTLWIEFDTLEKANNCIAYFKTDFARFCLALVKTDKNLRSKLHMVPKMDFVQEWTDEKLYAHFSITEEEQAFIKEVIPPYYD